MTDVDLASELRLPCGATLPNRIAKSAMTEGLADEYNRATDRHVRLYQRWSEGGAGLLITGNVMIDRHILERPGNVAIDGNGGLEALRRWVRAGTAGGNHLWMQISHAGRQSPKYVTREPVAPSEVQLKLGGSYARPRALTDDEITDLVRRYGEAARVARETGFTGVQVHGAHGYLISSFLSPVVNRRADRWGGSLQNRARFLIEVLHSVRRAVGDDFPVGLKLNSADFQKGGFTHEECLQVVRWLNDTGLDLLEISGGTYEQPRLLGYEGQAATADLPPRESTRRREAYFLEYAADIRRIAAMPLMVTGGFRSRAAMDQALAGDELDVVGLARPMCVRTDVPARLLDGSMQRAPAWENEVRLGRGWLGPNSPVFPLKIVNIMGQQGWYYLQLLRLGDGREPDTGMGVLRGLLGNLRNELRTARALRHAAPGETLESQGT
ncbi:MAG TPA: NADH:flavin oxidoreductase/NADH oxidase family protein [Gammaproteobacteria bacterium]|nr:NADH:flavin oxidoreductase/NADH oxidase family protein [Gammaproteobacteria bacterium]